MIATKGSIWINPLIWNPKKPAAHALINAKQSIKSSFDIIFLTPPTEQLLQPPLHQRLSVGTMQRDAFCSQ